MRKPNVLITVVVAILGTVTTCFAETPVGSVAVGYRSLLYAADVPSNAEGPGLLETDLAGNVYIAFNVEGVHKLLPDLNGDTYTDGLVQIISHSVRPSFVKLSQDGRYLFTAHEAVSNRLVEYDLQTDTSRYITSSIIPIDITTRMVGNAREIYQHAYRSDTIYKTVDLNPTDDHTDSAQALFDPPGNIGGDAHFVLRWGPGVTAAGDYGTRLYYAPGSAIYRADVDASTPSTELFSEFDCTYFDFDRWGDFGGYMYARQGNSIYQIMPDGTAGQVLASYSEVVRDLVFAKDGSALYVGVGDDIVAITLIPEPATLGLLITGGLVLLRRKA